MKSDKKDILKSKMIEALVKNKGNVTNACNSVDISRNTHYEWLKDDELYAEKCNDVVNVAIDYVENKLFDRIEEGDTTATIFYLKTIGKRRGYVERAEVTGKDGKDLHPGSNLKNYTSDELKTLAAIDKKAKERAKNAK